MNTIFEKVSFVDYAGQEHKCVVAGVVNSYKEGEAYISSNIESSVLYDSEGHVVFDSDDKVVLVQDYDETPIYKEISIGISICNPTDAYSDWRGEKQAEGRAIKYRDRVIAMSKGGMCTEDTVKFFVKTTAENLKNNPGLFIKGYNEAEKKYKKA